MNAANAANGANGANGARRARRRAARTTALVLAATGLVVSGAVGLPAKPVQVRAQSTAATTTPAALREAVAHGVPTEAQAQAVARAAGESVEVTGLRQERRTVVANGDGGSFTAQEFAEPVRTWKNGTWDDIDQTLVQRADGSWTPKATRPTSPSPAAATAPSPVSASPAANSP